MDYIFKRGRQLLRTPANDYAHALTLARHDASLNQALPVGFYSATENVAYVSSDAEQGVALGRIRSACNLVKSHSFDRIEVIDI